MLMRFDPFREIDRVSQMLSQQGSGRVSSSMPMDAYREGDSFVVRFDLPGVDPASIDLTVEKNVLTVRAERSWEPSEGQDVVIAERPQGTFTRQIFLGESLDAENVSASYDHGVLTLMIPVAEQAKPRKVEVQAGDGHDRAIPATATAGSATSEEERQEHATQPA
jgi:HSP20 family protein